MKTTREKDWRSFKSIKEAVFSRSLKQKEKGIYKMSLRWLSIPFVKILAYTPITANQVTILAVLSLVLSAIPFALGGFWYGLLGVFLLYLGELWDYVDGPIARIKKMSSRLPCHLLTHFYHQGSLSLIFIGLGLGVFRLTGDSIYVYAGFLGSFFHLFTVYVLELKMALLLEYEYDHFKEVHDGSKAFVSSKSKLQNLLFKMFVFPVARMREIIFISILFGLFNLPVLNWLVLFYGIFLPVRGVLFFAYTYWNFKKFEEKKKNAA